MYDEEELVGFKLSDTEDENFDDDLSDPLDLDREDKDDDFGLDLEEN
ncbi:MAG: hypothetical protein WCX46_01630 [Candidatus Paceibacterota bacterium]